MDWKRNAKNECLLAFSFVVPTLSLQPHSLAMWRHRSALTQDARRLDAINFCVEFLEGLEPPILKWSFNDKAHISLVNHAKEAEFFHQDRSTGMSAIKRNRPQGEVQDNSGGLRRTFADLESNFPAQWNDPSAHKPSGGHD